MKKAYTRELIFTVIIGVILGLVLSHTTQASEALLGANSPWPEVLEAQGEAILVKWEGDGQKIRPALRIDGQIPPQTWDGHLKIGQRLETSQKGLRVLVIWHQPEQGYIFHQYLEGPFLLVVGEDGIPEVEGVGWAHLFRTLSQALAPFTVNYDTVNTGFESTEVARLKSRDAQFLVIEGRVRVDGVHGLLTAGNSVHLHAKTREIHTTSKRKWAKAIEMGNEAQSLVLDRQARCTQNHLQAGNALPLYSGVCFKEGEDLHAKLAIERQRMNDKSIPPYAKMAEIYMEGGLYAEAAGLYHRAHESGDSHPIEMGNAHWLAGQTHAAIDAYELSKSKEGLTNLALSAGAVGAYEKSAKALESLLENDGSNLDLKSRLALSLLGMGEVERAMDLFESVSLHAPEMATTPWFHEAHAWARAEMADPEKAVQRAEERLSRDKDSPEAWYELGRTLQKAGRSHEAFRAYDRAMQLEMERAKKDLP